MAGDSLFDNVVLLLPFNGANSGTTFEDRSKSPKNFTVTGNAKTSTTQSKYGGASAYFDGSGDYINATSADLALGTQDFTVEFWANIDYTYLPSTWTAFLQIGTDATNGVFGIVKRAGTSELRVDLYNGGWSSACDTTGAGLTSNTWQHIAVTRASGVFRVYVDGVKVGENTPTLANYTQTKIYIGSRSTAGTTGIKGYLQDLRITTGIARYTNNSFTPTQCQIGYSSQHDLFYGSVATYLLFDGSHGATTTTDISLNPLTYTFNSGATESFARSRIGNGSLALTAAGSYLSTPSTSKLVFGNDDFAIDAWVYVTSAGSIRTIASKGSTTSVGWVFAISASNLLTFTIGTTAVATGATTLNANTWYHLAASRNSGLVGVYVNGVRDGTGTDATNLTDTGELRLGRARSTDTNYLLSYIDSFRITNDNRGWSGTLDIPYFKISGLLVDQGQIYTTGNVPGFSFQVRAIPSQGQLSLVGQQANVTRAYGDMPSIGNIHIAGQIPKIPTPYSGYATSGTIAITGRSPSLSSFIKSVTYADVTGQWFRIEPDISATNIAANSVTGQWFKVTPEIYSGAVVQGQWFDVQPSITATSDYLARVTGQWFSVQPEITAKSNWLASVTGRFFKVEPEIYTGATVTGQWFSVDTEISASADVLTTVTGQWFRVNPDISASYVHTAQVTGQWFKVELSHNEVTGQWFKVEPLISTAFDASYAQAFVMNTMTNEVTRYTNYPFIHLAKIGADYYGFTAQGIYQITGTKDVDTAVSTSITTKETDFGVFQSKNVPVVYANSDDHFTLRPIVDGQSSANHDSTFAGRKAKLGRGLKGRYWAFKLDDFQSLQGIELLPEQLQRRVK